MERFNRASHIFIYRIQFDVSRDSWVLSKFFGFSGFGIGTDAVGITSAYNPSYTY